MPQATPELRAQWAGDADALAQLESSGIAPVHGHFTIPLAQWMSMSRRDDSALDYLISEWDYTLTYEPGRPAR